MNRVQLGQVAIIVVACVFAYQCINCFGMFIANVFSSFLGAETNTYIILLFGFGALTFAIAFFLLLGNASKLSQWIINKVQPDESIDISFSDRSVIYGVLLLLTLSSLLKNIPFILFQAFELFKKSAGASAVSRDYDPLSAPDYPKWIETIIAFIILVKAKFITDYLHSKIDPNDPHAITHTDEHEEIPTDEN